MVREEGIEMNNEGLSTNSKHMTFVIYLSDSLRVSYVEQAYVRLSRECLCVNFQDACEDE